MVGGIDIDEKTLDGMVIAKAGMSGNTLMQALQTM